MTEHKPSRGSCLGQILVALVFLWIIAVVFSLQLIAWSAPLLGGDRDIPQGELWQAVLIGLPLLVLTWLWRTPRQRAIFGAWLLATGYALILVPSRLFPPAQSQLVLLAQLGLSLAYLALVWFLGPRAPGPSRPERRSGLLPALAVAALVAWPWLAWGALGSLLDTLLALALGLVAGLVAGRIVGRTWLRSQADDSRGRGWDLFTGGLVIGTTWLIMASGLSFNGVQLLLMLALPGLGWIAMALSYQPASVPFGGAEERGRYTWRPLAWLAGLVTATVIALTDSDTMSLLAMDPALRWAFQSAGISLLVGWILAAIALLARNHWGRPVRPALVGGAAVALWLVGLVVYFAAGQPGWHGDRLFVILKDQADVSAAEDIQNYDQRRGFVYDSLVSHASQTQAGLRASLDRFGMDYQPYYLVDAIEVEGGLLARLLLSTRPDVDRIIPSPVLRPLPELQTTAAGQQAQPSQPQWNLTNIGADRVWTELGVRGEGIVVGQSDSGVQLDHPELQASYRGHDGRHDYNWLDPWAGTPAPTDFQGHGTHTLGSVVGQSVGVAPGAEWFACVNLQRNLGNPALYLDCMQFMLAPYPQGGDPFRDGDPARSAHVLNNSWGCPEAHEGCDPQSLLPAVQALRAAGIFVVASAGNDGPACGTVRDPLPIYAEVFSVGAVDANNDLGIFSSVGPVTVDGSGRTKPDLVAPGVQVLSAFPGSSYAELDGTSMAGPHVAGVVALMWSANPHLVGDIDRTEQILRDTATPFSGHVAGIDPQAALAQLLG